MFSSEKTLKEVKGKVSDDEIKKAEAARDALKKAQEANNVEDMKTKKDELMKLVQEMSVKLYQQAQEANKAGQATDAKTADGDNGSKGSDNKGDDNTVEGDFKEVNPDDDKK